MSSIRIAKCSLPSSGRRRSAPTGSSIQYRPSPSNARPRWCPSSPRLLPEGRAQGDRRGRGVRAFPTWIRIPASGPYPAGPSSGGAAAVAVSSYETGGYVLLGSWSTTLCVNKKKSGTPHQEPGSFWVLRLDLIANHRAHLMSGSRVTFSICPSNWDQTIRSRPT